MTGSKKRRLVHFLRRGERAVDLLALLWMIGFFLYQLPFELLSSTLGPATGGDLGSHYWPLYTLFHHGIPEGTLRVWNPGNLAGEPQLVHYFPLPFLLMAGLGLFMPLPMAFNLGSILPIPLLPLCVYLTLRLMRCRFPTPVLGATASLCFLYNEAYSIWGGNALSTLSGQFAHAYAVLFFLLGTGTLCREIDSRRMPLLSGLLFAGVATSHAYIELLLPWTMLGIVLFYPSRSWKERFVAATISGTESLLLAAWFIVPMVDNQRWTTPAPMSWWSDPLLFGDVFSTILLPIVAAIVVSLPILLLSRASGVRRQSLRRCGVWIVPAFASLAYFFIFPKLGLVDIRSIPQLQLSLCIVAAELCGAALLVVGKVFAWVATLPVVLLVLWWVDLHAVTFPNWLRWNLGGWEQKILYPEVRKLSDAVRGDLSMPRVIFEHSVQNNPAGSLRVFEMLPYFASRATLESVYMQANILAKIVFDLESYISKTPSCPFGGKCPPYDLERAKPLLELFGVGELILASDEVIGEARSTGWLEPRGEFGPWHLFRLKEQPSLIEIVDRSPISVPRQRYRERFAQWFQEYAAGKELLVSGNSIDRDAIPPASAFAKAAEHYDCQPRVKAEFNKILLETNCPGTFHLLKFAYHPTWSADSGDGVFLVSPGFLGIIPSHERVVLNFGVSKLWSGASWVSVGSFVVIVLLWFRNRRTGVLL